MEKENGDKIKRQKERGKEKKGERWEERDRNKKKVGDIRKR